MAWFVTVGIAFYLSLQSMAEDGYFRTTARRAVRASVFVEVFVNLAVFSLPVELVFLPVVTFFAVLAAYAEGREEHAPARRFADGPPASEARAPPRRARPRGRGRRPLRPVDPRPSARGFRRGRAGRHAYVPSVLAL